MQAVFLAAGQGIRLRPFTYHVPKPLLRIASKNLIEHNLDQLPAEIDELVFVVGYLAEQIINHFGQEYQGRKITYVRQNKLLGTGYALQACKSILRDRFLVLMADDIYCQADMQKCLQNEQSILTCELSGKVAGGRIILNNQGYLKDIIEGVHNRQNNLINTGLYVLTDKFFHYKLVPINNDKKEFGLPQTLVTMAQDHVVNIEKSSFWLQVNSLDSLKRIESVLLNRKL